MINLYLVEIQAFMKPVLTLAQHSGIICLVREGFIKWYLSGFSQ